MGELRITSGHGFHITFENGITASVQFGPGNYCDNYNANFAEKPKRGWESTTAEVAAMDERNNGEWMTTEILKDNYGDDVRPRFTVEQVMDFLNMCQHYVRKET